MSFDFPPVRNLFIPDPGWTIIDIDLAGADARVVAWDAGDEDLKAAFRRGEKIHAKNSKDVFGIKRAGEDGKAEPYYTKAKKGVHATNYGARQNALAQRCGMTPVEAGQFQRTWFQLHPAIKSWHREIEHELQTKRMLYNKFGYRCPFFDRPENSFNQALAWRPQSTVAEVTFQAMRLIRKHLHPDARLLMQVHDSLVIQIKTHLFRPTLRNLHELIHSIEVPYDDPLIIPWGIKYSASSWGECREVGWNQII